MHHKISTLGLSVAAALCLTALRASAADDVTIQVLDDVKEVAKVIADVDRSLHADASVHAVKPDAIITPERRPPGAPSPAESGPVIRYFGSIIDHEEDGEGKIQDFDVPKDVVVPAGN
jgi:hypothetical protein